MGDFVESMTKSVLILSLLFYIGCFQEPAKPHDFLEPILSGEHELKAMEQKDTTNGKLSGSFFWFVGSVNGESETIRNVYFSWKRNDGTYAISSVPLEHIRIKIDNSKRIPTIKFRWSPLMHNGNVDWRLMEYVSYVLVTCREDMWHPKLTMPFEKP